MPNLTCFAVGTWLCSYWVQVHPALSHISEDSDLCSFVFWSQKPSVCGEYKFTLHCINFPLLICPFCFNIVAKTSTDICECKFTLHFSYFMNLLSLFCRRYEIVFVMIAGSPCTLLIPWTYLAYFAGGTYLCLWWVQVQLALFFVHWFWLGFSFPLNLKIGSGLWVVHLALFVFPCLTWLILQAVRDNVYIEYKFILHFSCSPL